MNFTARAFQRNSGPQPSVSVTTVDGQTITSGNLNDRIDIRAGAFNRGGYAEATGLNNSSIATAAGNDSVRIHAHARGMSTNAWAMRNSSLDVGPGHDKIDLRAVTRAGAFDPAYGMDTSSIITGLGNDKLRINAIARGNTTSTIAAYGALNSQINTGANHDNARRLQRRLRDLSSLPRLATRVRAVGALAGSAGRRWRRERRGAWWWPAHLHSLRRRGRGLA